MAISAQALLSAALFLGQTQETPSTPAIESGAKTAQPARSSPMLFPRLQRLFGRSTDTPTTPAPTPAPAPAPRVTTTSKKTTVTPPTAAPTTTPTAPTTQPTEFPRRMPMGSTRKTPEVVPVQDVQAAAATVQKTASPILPVNANRIGREDNFKWVTGQIELSKNGTFLYYATPDTVDPHNGVVVLQASPADLKQFQSGDLVSAQGTLQVRATGQAPFYRVTSIDLIERPKR